MGKSSKIRPLGNKNPNTTGFGGKDLHVKCKRKVSSPNSRDPNLAEKSEHINENTLHQDLASNRSIAENDSIEILERKLKSNPVVDKIVQHMPLQCIQPLTKSNLAQLQKEMTELESGVFPCNHFLCGQENKAQLNSLRLWLLFEMEVTHDTVTNLRDTCYHHQVYEAISPSWKIKSCLAQNSPHGCEHFPIEQLLIPNIEIKQIAQHEEGVDMKMGDLVKGSKKIPSTFLSSRHTREIFDEGKINAEVMINGKTQASDKTMSAESDEDNCLQEETLRSKRYKREPQLCTLEKKLALINGTSIPRLPK